MTNLLKEKIIAPAWDIIKNDTSIKKFYLLPWLLSIIFLSVLLVYQSIYTYVEIFWKTDEALVIILNFFHSDYVIEVLITTIIFLIIYFLVTPIFEWWLIKYIHAKNNKIEMSPGDAFWEWIYKFLPIFEYNNLFSEFKLISILNWYLFTIRFIWVEYIWVLTNIFIFVLLLWILINILFAYTKYAIIINDKPVFKAIWYSSKITILNLNRTIRLYFLMLFLNLRVIFNFIIFLSFPIVIVIAIWLITTKLFLIVAVTILLILFIFFIWALWYLTAVLEIFTTSIWYYAYIEWKKKLEDKKTD